jgi:hypothetical protein
MLVLLATLFLLLQNCSVSITHSSLGLSNAPSLWLLLPVFRVLHRHGSYWYCSLGSHHQGTWGYTCHCFQPNYIKGRGMYVSVLFRKKWFVLGSIGNTKVEGANTAYCTMVGVPWGKIRSAILKCEIGTIRMKGSPILLRYFACLYGWVLEI